MSYTTRLTPFTSLMMRVPIAWSTATMGGAANYARVGPTTFPYVIAAALFILAIWTVFAALRGDFPEREEQAVAPMVWIVGGLAAQMLLADGRELLSPVFEAMLS